MQTLELTVNMYAVSLRGGTYSTRQPGSRGLGIRVALVTISLSDHWGNLCFLDLQLTVCRVGQGLQRGRFHPGTQEGSHCTYNDVCHQHGSFGFPPASGSGGKGVSTWTGHHEEGH